MPELCRYQELVARSSGTRYKHYAPNAKVVLIATPDEITNTKNAAFIGLNQPEQNFKLEKVCLSVEEYAHSVFDFFRQCDEQKIGMIYCQTVIESNLGLALMDRLKRAAN